MSARTLLLLGGSAQQVIAIEEAKRCGYRTVVCDYLPDNPGQYHADAFYLTSTTDRDAVLEVARAENVDGIVAYASDPAAPTAAYVATAMGLPTNPLDSVEILSTKTLIRQHLREIGMPCPNAVAIPGTATAAQALDLMAPLHYPLVVKPTDSSGSKGVTVLSDPTGLASALDFARSFNRNGILIAEEFIHNAYDYVVGGDIFVQDGEIRFWGFMNCVRSKEHPLVPFLETLPTKLPPDILEQTKDALQTLVSSLNLRFGELNVEVIIDPNGIPYILELGARAGGNMVPIQLADASGINLVRACVMSAMGDDPGRLDWETDGGCIAAYVLHARQKGIYRGYTLSDELAATCYREVPYKDPGTQIRGFQDASDALGILFFRFQNEHEMDAIMEHLDDHIVVQVE